MSQQNRGSKRLRISSGDNEVMDIKSPDNSQEITSPKKGRMDYDFWGTQASSSQKSTWISFADLAQGGNFIDALKFRVTLTNGLRDSKSGVKYLTFKGMDNAGGEISFVAFRQEAEKFFELIEVDKLFSLNNFNVRNDSDQNSRGSGNTLQIVLSTNSIINNLDDDKEFAPIPFMFLPLKEIENQEVKSVVDVLGIMVKSWPEETIANGAVKRELILVDQDKTNLHLTLWNWKAQEFSAKEFDVIAVRKGIVNLFSNKRCINSSVDSLVMINPDIEETHVLKAWFQEEMKKKEEEEMETNSDTLTYQF